MACSAAPRALRVCYVWLYYEEKLNDMKLLHKNFITGRLGWKHAAFPLNLYF